MHAYGKKKTYVRMGFQNAARSCKVGQNINISYMVRLTNSFVSVRFLKNEGKSFELCPFAPKIHYGKS